MYHFIKSKKLKFSQALGSKSILVKIIVNAPESTEGLINFIIIFYNGGYYGRFYFT